MGYNILIIDDLKSIFNSISSLLTPKECNVNYQPNGKEGLAEVKRNNYDLIILDIHMPDVNGIEVCKQIKELPYYKFRPILLLTSDTKYLESGLIAGAADYILKPFNQVEMMARVFTQLNLSKERLATSSEKEFLELNLNKERIKLQEVQADLHQYFYQTAHKLRSPIKSMKGLLLLLKAEYPEVCEYNYIKLLNETVEKLDQVNGQVAMIGELKAHRPSKIKVELKQYLNEVILCYFAESSIKLDISEEINLLIDPFLFLSGIKPIIENAIFYSSLSKNPDKVINISSTFKNDQLYLLIKDQGPGIEKKLLHKVYDMFYVGNVNSIGNGLGLFVSKIAFNKLKMKLDIYSEENCYTIAQIQLTPAYYDKNTDV